MRLGAIDADGYLGARGTELLEESAISSDPQVLLRYLHLGARLNVTHSKTFLKNGQLSSVKVLAYSTQVARARRGVQAEEKPCNCNHVVFNKRLREETLKHVLAVEVKKRHRQEIFKGHILKKIHSTNVL